MARKGSKRAIKISLRDFKQWLAGVEDMQPEDWTPTAEQWSRIREQIDMIKETVTVETTEEQSTTTAHTTPQAPAPFFDSAPPGIELPPSALPAIQPPSQNTALERGRPAPMVAPSNSSMVRAESGMTAKTPDIDSSGGYQTGFK